MQFEEFKNEHVAILEQEVERIVRMFDSRRGFLDDRIKRTKGQISSIQRHGLEHQKRIIPALRGQVDAAERRVRELEKERKERLRVVHGATPEFRLRLLAVTVVVPEGGLQELAT